MRRDFAVGLGGTVAIMIAAAAVAQDRERTAPPVRDPGSRTVDPNQQDAKLDNSRILRQLEGAWKVEVSLNEKYFGPSGSGGFEYEGADDARGSDQRGRESTVRPTTPPDSTSTGGMMELSGVARTSLILGSILKESFAILPASDSPSSDPSRPVGAAPRDDDSRMASGKAALRCLSFIACEDGDTEYSMAIMDNQRSGIRFATGSLDVATNRIVFSSEGSKKQSANPGSITTPGDRTQPKTGNVDHHMGDVSVVVELYGPNRHRVTMYSGNVPDASRPGTPGQGAGQDRTDERSRSDQDRRTGDPARTDQDPAARKLSTDDGNIVYQATYTRMSDAEAAKYREMLDIEATPRATASGERSSDG